MTERDRRERPLATGPRAYRLRLGLTRKLLVLTGISLAALMVGTSTAAAPSPEFAFGARAYGTQVSVKKNLVSGPSALVFLGCASKVGVRHNNSAASVNVPHTLSTGTIRTKAASKATKTGVASTGSASTQYVSLLDGVVRANVVKAVSKTKHNTATNAFQTSAAGTTFVGLVVDGHHIGATPAANTKIKLPGIGYVVLNQQTSRSGASSTGLKVIGIHLVVTVTSTTAVAGTQAFVSVASSSLSGPVAGLLRGLAYGTSANVGKTVIAGKSFPEYVNCRGTNGKTKKNSGATATIPGVLTTGAITDKEKGTVTATQVFGKTSSTIHYLNLLGGTITATAVKASVSARGNPPTLGDHSSFLGLKVAGMPQINGNPAPNTKISLPGIGTLWLHRRIKSSTAITVIMVQLVIKHANNPAHLPVGAKVDVGYAKIGVS